MRFSERDRWVLCLDGESKGSDVVYVSWCQRLLIKHLTEQLGLLTLRIDAYLAPIATGFYY